MKKLFLSIMLLLPVLVVAEDNFRLPVLVCKDRIYKNFDTISMVDIEEADTVYLQVQYGDTHILDTNSFISHYTITTNGTKFQYNGSELSSAIKERLSLQTAYAPLAFTNIRLTTKNDDGGTTTTQVPLFVLTMRPKEFENIDKALEILKIAQSENKKITPPKVLDDLNSLSKKFSREFIMPNDVGLNSFTYKNKGIITYKGLYNNKKETGISTTLVNERESAKMSKLLGRVDKWLEQNNVKWKPGMIDGVPATMYGELCLYYSPIYYAENGDTLHCRGQIVNSDGKYCDDASCFYRFWVDNTDTHTYAVVNRDSNLVSLLYYEDSKETPLYKEQYVIYKPDSIIKTGYQEYYDKNGSFLFRQFFKNNKLQYTEYLDANANVYAKCYLEDMETYVYPQLKYQELFYPSGEVMLRTMIQECEIQQTAYDVDGSLVKYSHSPNVKNAVTKYIKKSIGEPQSVKFAMGRVGINTLKMSLNLICSVNQKGEVKVIKICYPIEWKYNYDTSYSNKSIVDDFIQNQYQPLLKEYLLYAMKDVHCIPCKVNGMSVKSYVNIHINCEVGSY